MELALSMAENVIEALGELVFIKGDKYIKSKGVLFRNKRANELSDYVETEEVSLYVLHSVPVKVGDSIFHKKVEYEVTRITKEENGTKKLGVRCKKEHK